MKYLILFGCVVQLFFSACYCSCNCQFCEGCKIVSVRYSTSDSLVARKSFCTSNNVLLDQALVDSVDNFKKKYTGSMYTFVEKDSTWNCDNKNKLSCKEANKLKKYACTCFK